MRGRGPQARWRRDAANTITAVAPRNLVRQRLQRRGRTGARARATSKEEEREGQHECAPRSPRGCSCGKTALACRQLHPHARRQGLGSTGWTGAHGSHSHGSLRAPQAKG